MNGDVMYAFADLPSIPGVLAVLCGPADPNARHPQLLEMECLHQPSAVSSLPNSLHTHHVLLALK